MAHTCVRREKLRDGNQPLGDVFLNKQVFLKLTFCLFPHKQLSKYWCQPLCWPSRFLHFFPSMDRIETKSGRGRRVGEGSWSRIPAPFSRKSRITLFFSSLFRIPAFASKNNNNNNNRKKKIAHLFGSHLPLHKRMISRIPDIQGKNPPSRLNFQNVFWSLQKDPLKGKWSPAKSCFKQNYFHVCLLRKFTNYAFFRIPHLILVNYTLNNYNK